MSDIDEREEVYCFDIDGCLGEEKIGDCLNAKPKYTNKVEGLRL